MGKSFLLKNIEARLRSDAENGNGTGPAVHVVSFNAWEYSASEVIWPGLVGKTLGALEDRTSNGFTKLWRRLRQRRSAAEGRPRTDHRRPHDPDRRRRSGFRPVPVQHGRSDRRRRCGWSRWGREVRLGRALRSARAVVHGALRGPGLRRAIGYMEEIKHDLEDLQKNLKGDRILVVIDDLDRCEPDKAVEVLQAINLLLTFESFIVCLGIDARVITRAIERHYEDLLAESGASGYEYLEKIVQIPFRIPDPSDDDVMRFLLKQLGDPKPDGRPPEPDKAGGEAAPGPGTGTEQADSPAGGPAGPPRTGPPAARHAEGQPPEGGTAEPPPTAPPPVAFTWTEVQGVRTLTPFLRHNPRRLKRLVNVYRLVRTLAAREGSTQVSGIRSPRSAGWRWRISGRTPRARCCAGSRGFSTSGRPICRTRPPTTEALIAEGGPLEEEAPGTGRRRRALGRAARMPARPVVVGAARRDAQVHGQLQPGDRGRDARRSRSAEARPATPRSPGRCRPGVGLPAVRLTALLAIAAAGSWGIGGILLKRAPTSSRPRRSSSSSTRSALCSCSAGSPRASGRGGRTIERRWGTMLDPRPLPDRGLHPLRHERRERGHGPRSRPRS